jgi:hypothetical protein
MGASFVSQAIMNNDSSERWITGTAMGGRELLLQLSGNFGSATYS